MSSDTQDDTHISRGASSGEQPGVVVVYAVDRPCCHALRLGDGELHVGRDELAAVGITDGRVSRRHTVFELADGRWSVRDQESRNGTFVDGRQVLAARQLAAPVVRVGRTLLLALLDVRPFESRGVTRKDGFVMGPALQEVHERIALGARGGANLLIRGESGAGKELAAKTFHAAGGEGQRPFVAVNCATIHKDLAEATLFGARKGAYTGSVAERTGLVQAADGGTLFLDEVAELDPAVQAKLLRVLETREVTPLGSVEPIAVDLRLCAATLKDLRSEVTEGRFREDLYFRIARPMVELPPLSQRREEIPWLVCHALAESALENKPTASAEFVETCMLRAWPGNVRELLAEVATAAVSAASRGRASVSATDLDEEAGLSLRPSVPPDTDERPGSAMPAEAEIAAALRAESGNVARAAARLGISRSRLRRFIERQGMDLDALRS